MTHSLRKYLAIPWKASVLMREDIQIEWLVEGLIPVMGKVLLAAQWKTGKSLLAMQLAHAISQGSRFLKYDAANPVPTTLIDLEIGPAIMVDRLRRMAPVYPDAGDNITIVMLRSGREGLDSALLSSSTSQLVIVDPAISIGYDNENESAPVRRKLDEISDMVAGELGASTMLVHHVRKPPRDGLVGSLLNESRGSSAFVDWCDVGIGMAKAGGGRFKVEVVNRSAPDEEPYYIVRDSNTLTYNMEGPQVIVTPDLVEECVIEWQVGNGKDVSLRPSQEEVVKRLQHKVNRGRTVVLQQLKDIGGYKKH